jgi:hypothetical protein
MLTKEVLEYMSSAYDTIVANVENHYVSFLLKELHDSYYELFHTETEDEFTDVGMKIDDIVDELLKDPVIGSIQSVQALLESMRALMDDIYDARFDQVWLIKVEAYFYLLNKQIEFLSV